eukprot:scaffold651_cov284-Prasinococcus_capsulatus_cf.AAC.2
MMMMMIVARCNYPPARGTRPPRRVRGLVSSRVETGNETCTGSAGAMRASLRFALLCFWPADDVMLAQACDACGSWPHACTHVRLRLGVGVGAEGRCNGFAVRGAPGRADAHLRRPRRHGRAESRRAASRRVAFRGEASRGRRRHTPGATLELRPGAAGGRVGPAERARWRLRPGLLRVPLAGHGDSPCVSIRGGGGVRAATAGVQQRRRRRRRGARRQPLGVGAAGMLRREHVRGGVRGPSAVRRAAAHREGARPRAPERRRARRAGPHGTCQVCLAGVRNARCLALVRHEGDAQRHAPAPSYA